MTRTAIILFLCVSTASIHAQADCVRNQYGKVVCGKGECAADRYGKVYCADAGGGAVKDEYGDVRCGMGYCARDYLQQVWCSREPGGAAAVDTYGKVKCLGGCEKGSKEFCREAEE